jgi:hypothetical protein
MTPDEVYGEYATLVMDAGDCWHWLGDVKFIGGKNVPAVRGANRHYRNALRDGLVKAEVISGVQGTSYYRACDNSLCVNPDHYTGYGTDVQRMITIRDMSEPVGTCLIWDGSESAEGLPMLQTVIDGVRTYISIQRFVYEMEHGVKLPSDVSVYTTCRNRKCVSFRHVAIKTPTVRPYTTTAGNGKQAREAEARRAHARMFIEEQNKKMIEEYR